MTVQVGAHDHVVLSALTWEQLEWIVGWRDYCFRSRFVLAATPHLQHLSLFFDLHCMLPPPVADLFAFVSRLRSLHLEQCDSDQSNTEKSIIPIHAMLALLPSLTSLHCVELHLGVLDLIDIAAHATLCELRLSSERSAYLDQEWLGVSITFPERRVGVRQPDGKEEDNEEEEEERDIAQDDSGEMEEQQATEADDDNCSGLDADELTDDEKHERRARDRRWLPIALTRVTPSERNIRARLPLANFLHRQLCRQQLKAEFQRPLSLLQHYRQQVNVLRSTLRSQLVTFSSAAAVPVGCENESEVKRCSKRARSG